MGSSSQLWSCARLAKFTIMCLPTLLDLKPDGKSRPLTQSLSDPLAVYWLAVAKPAFKSALNRRYALSEGTFPMNRRHFLQGSIALAGHKPLLRSMAPLSIAADATPAATSPQNLLAGTFSEAFLSSHLLPRRSVPPVSAPAGRTRRQGGGYPKICARQVIQQAEAGSKRPDGMPSWQPAF